jgi:hypothetical protein
MQMFKTAAWAKAHPTTNNYGITDYHKFGK